MQSDNHNNPALADAALQEEMEHWHIEEAAWKVQQILRMLQRQQLQPATICEVGSGSGDILQLLQPQLSHDCTLCGYDISPIAIQYARSKENDALSFKLKDIRNEPHTHFDLMLVMDVLEHIQDSLGFLRDIRTQAEYKLFQVSLNISAQTVLRKSGLLNLRRIYGMSNFYTRETLLQTLQDSGYTIIDSFYTTPGFDLPTHVLKKKLLKIPRHLLFTLNQDLAVRLLGSFRLLVLAT